MQLKLKTIFTGFAPNLTYRDVLISLSFLVLPWNWPRIISGKNPALAERKLSEYFKTEASFVFDSGRTALFFALKALGVGPGDEVLVQAYTCMVVVNAIKWTGAKPIFIDVAPDFNMDPADLALKISPRCKVLIIQHTYGLSAKLAPLLALAKTNNLKVVEDCAHAFGAKYNGRLVGTFGDVGLLSFGSDKVLSCVRGGALITNNSQITESLKGLQVELACPGLKVTLQHLLQGPVFYTGKLLYGLYLGKIILSLAKRFNLINKIIYPPEKQGEPVNFYPAKLANSLARLLLGQLDQVDQVNLHRKKIAQYYVDNLVNPLIEQPLQGKEIVDDCVYLRYPILCKEPKQLLRFAKQYGIMLGNWYDSVIAPQGIDLSKTDYEAGSCPIAEKLASQSVNLPTNRHVSLQEASYVVQIINDYKYGS